MSKKSIKINVDYDEYRNLEALARRSNLSLSSFMKEMASRVTKKSGSNKINEGGVLFDSKRARSDDEILKEVADSYNTSGERKKAEYEYTLVGDRLYPLWLQLGARLPSIGIDEAFYVSVGHAKRPNFTDITDSLTEFEKDWVLAWAYCFEEMDELWWYRQSIWSGEDRYATLDDYKQILENLKKNIKVEDLRNEEEIAKLPFNEKYTEELSNIGLLNDKGGYRYRKDKRVKKA